MSGTYILLCNKFGSLINQRPKKSIENKLLDASSFLKIPVAPKEIESAAIVTGIICFVLSLLAFFLIFSLWGFSILSVMLFLLGPLCYVWFERYLIMLASSKKKEASREILSVFAYLVMSLRVNPNLEDALVFCAKHAKGELGRLLIESINDIRTGHSNAKSAIFKIAKIFPDYPEFGAAIGLLYSSTLEKDEVSRQKTLDKASSNLLSGISLRARRQARKMVSPVMALFTFGVIVPLVMVALIPFMSLMGIDFGEGMFAILYCVIIPVFLLFGVHIVSGLRPIGLAPPSIKCIRPSFMIVLLAVFLGTLCLIPFILNMFEGALALLPLLWAPSVIVSIILILPARKALLLAKKTKAIESQFPESLRKLSILTSQGKSLERAMAEMEDTIFFPATAYASSFGVSIRDALLGGQGTVSQLHSDAITSACETILAVSQKGPHAISQVALRISDQMVLIKETEDEIERGLGQVASSMKVIALFVAPLVGGLIASMSAIISETLLSSSQSSQAVGFSSGGMLPIEISTLVIGIYIIESAIILSNFAVYLLNGNFSAAKRLSIGLAIILSCLIFCGCAWLGGVVFGGIA